MGVRQGVSTQLPRVVRWVKELLLGGQEVRRVVQTVQGVQEVHLRARMDEYMDGQTERVSEREKKEKEASSQNLLLTELMLCYRSTHQMLC